ncbi:MAG TPA: DoxX family protein [Acidimicrobiia bacterium]|jgi:putative oxidoreductase
MTTASAATFDAATAAPQTRTRTGTVERDALARDAALLAARLTVGFLMFGHGAQHLFGWWGGPGFDGIAAGLGHIGYTPAHFFAALLGGSEVAGGVLLMLGLLTPLGAAAVIGVLTNAIVTVHWSHGAFAPNGFEYPLLLAVAAATLAFTGPGQLSVDRRWRWSQGGALSGLLAVALGIGGALIVLAVKAVG